jgi:hypothetical protein
MAELPPSYRKEDFQRAKQVVLEIVRQSTGDEIVGKVKLFKAFYFAHLYFATSNAGLLSEWPIVNMPNGPGIDNFGTILEALQNEQTIETDTTNVGPFKAVLYRATGRPSECGPLPQNAIDAIRRAVEFVAEKKGAQLSDITHEHSRSWNESQLGEELSIYLDLLSDEDYAKRIQKSRQVRGEVEKTFA